MPKSKSPLFRISRGDNEWSKYEFPHVHTYHILQPAGESEQSSYMTNKSLSFIADTMSRIVFVNNQIFARKTRRDTKQRKYDLFWLARRAVQKKKLMYFVICEYAARPTHRISHNNVDLMIFIQLSSRIAYLPIKVSLWPKAQRDASIWF